MAKRDQIEELESHNMTPDRALEIVSRIKGPTGISAAKEELKNQIEARKIMLVKIQAQIDTYQAFDRTLSALETVWGLNTPADAPLPIVKGGSDEQSDLLRKNKEVVEKHKDEISKRIIEGKCSFKSTGPEGGKWCARKMKSKREKTHGYCSIHMNALDIKD